MWAWECGCGIRTPPILRPLWRADHTPKSGVRLIAILYYSELLWRLTKLIFSEILPIKPLNTLNNCSIATGAPPLRVNPLLNPFHPLLNISLNPLSNASFNPLFNASFKPLFHTSLKPVFNPLVNSFSTSIGN